MQNAYICPYVVDYVNELSKERRNILSKVFSFLTLNYLN